MKTASGCAGGRLRGSVGEICRMWRRKKTSRLVSRGDRRRGWSATITLCQRRVSHGHGSVSPIQDWTRLVAAAEPTVDERWPAWQDIPSFRRKRPRGAFRSWAGRNSSGRVSRGCPVAVCGEFSPTERRLLLAHDTVAVSVPCAGHHPLQRARAPTLGAAYLAFTRRSGDAGEAGVPALRSRSSLPPSGSYPSSTRSGQSAALMSQKRKSC